MRTPKQTDPQFKLRLTPELDQAIEAAAAESGRTKNAEILFRLSDALSGGSFPLRLPEGMLERIEDGAAKNGRSINDEIIEVLERAYPAPSDVMHVHLHNIRHALDLYERETDPQARLRLQNLVESLVSAGHNIEIDWEDDE